MMLKWFSKSCDGVKYLLKTDDDMYNNLPKLRDFVTTLEVQRVSDIFIGSLLCTSIPERDPGHKWFMSPDIWPGRRDPPYLLGASYLMSRPAAEKLLSASLDTPLNHIEDFYLGLLARKKDIT